MLKVGLARADITPHAGIEMAGFGKRIQPSVGVNDPLYATALVADDGRTTIAMLDCELVFVSAGFTAEVREKAQQLAGIAGQNVTISCTHTHYGPTILRSNKGAAQRPGSYEKSYRDYLIHQLAGLIYEAKSNLQPARMRVGMGQCDIGVNRRQKTVDGQIILGENPSGPVDRTVGVCRIETAAGQPLATLVNFATHPVGQDVQVRKVSADYVGCMRRVVQDATGAPCLFWQGACGNINILSAETDYANVCARGTRLGQEVTRVWEAAQPIQSEEIRLVSRQLKLPPYCCLSREHAEQKRQEAQRDLETARKDPKSTPGLIAWLERDVKRLADLRDSWTNPALVPPPVEAQLQACRIGDLAWVCVPGELFNELGTEIKSRSPFRHTFVVAYANDWIGYLPTRQAFEEGGYEVSQVCYLSPEAIQMMVEEFVTMLGDLAKDPRADQT